MVWLPIYPWDDVVFPGERRGIRVHDERHHLMLAEVLHSGTPFGMALARPEADSSRIERQPERIGTAVRCIGAGRLEDQDRHVDVVGIRRFEVREVRSVKPYQEARVRWISEREGTPEAVAQGWARLGAALQGLGLNRRDVLDILGSEAITASYRAAATLEAAPKDLQRLLAARDAATRMSLACDLLAARVRTL